MITDRRTSMGVVKIDHLLFLQKNLSIFKKIFDQQLYEGEEERVKREVNQQENELIDISSKKSKKNENYEIINEEQEEVEENLLI
jgi:hypothetical protein